MGNNNNACRRCLRGSEGEASAEIVGESRLVVVMDENFSDLAATPVGSECTANGSNSGAGARGYSTESESLVPPGSSSGAGVRLLAHAVFPFTTDDVSMAWLRANRVMFLMRGLPGSGKSTLTRLLCQLYPGCTVCSADAYFTDPSSGAYKYVDSKRTEAHNACNNLAYEAMSAGKSPVIIDNTNVRRWEFQFYTDMAVRLGYVMLTVVPKTPWRFDAQVLANRTLHSVPLEIIEKRLTSWEAAHPTYYAWFLDSAESDRLQQLARDFLACLADADGAPNPPALDSTDRNRKLLHATARFCGRRGATQDELVAHIDYHNRQDVQAALGRVFATSVSAIFVTAQSIGFKMNLTEDQLTLWHHESEASQQHSLIPPGSRAHVTLATSSGVPAAQAGRDLLDILTVAASQPEPGPDDLVLMTEWGFARGCGPNTCLLTLNEPIALNTLFASSY